MLLISTDSDEVIVVVTLLDDSDEPVEDLVFDSSGLEIALKKPTDSTWTTLTLVTMTVGTWVDSGFAEEAGQDGRYQLGLPASFVTTEGADLRITIPGVSKKRYGKLVELMTGFGPGADNVTVTITQDSVPQDNVAVWLSASDGGPTVAGTRYTNSSGQVTFKLTAGSTYYLNAQKDGMESIDNESFVAVAD